jgi:hypothetical protein
MYPKPPLFRGRDHSLKLDSWNPSLLSFVPHLGIPQSLHDPNMRKDKT